MTPIQKKLLIRGGQVLSLVLLVVAIATTYAVKRPLDIPAAGPSYERLLVNNANLVDLESGQIQPGFQVLVENGQISATGTDLYKLLSGKSFTTLDAEGAYLIPGLFDMHVHSLAISPVLHHPLFIAAGVTAVRDMGGCLDDSEPWIACARQKRAWNEAAANGTAVSPRYDQVTSLPINGGDEIPGGFNRDLGAPHPDGARLRVAHDQPRGIDFLKPYSELSKDAYIALAEAADEAGMYLAGHKPFQVSGMEAVAAGQRSIEHAFLFIWECFPGIDNLRDRASIRASYTDDMRRLMISQHSEKRCSELRGAMAAAGTALVPTHTTRKLDAFASDPAFLSDERLRYIPAPLRQLWLSDADNMAERGEASSYQAFYRFGMEQTGRAHAAGVTILAGTDAPDSFVFPGSALHDELEHLVQAGLSEVSALRAATVEPARFLGLQGQAGVIAPGARADLVLLRDNPLEDINGVRSVETVLLAGVIYDRRMLDKLLAGVETAAGRWDMWPKFLWQSLNSPIMRTQIAD